MKRLYSFCIVMLSLIVTNHLIAQTEATTNDGRKVILNEDGTWNYLEPKLTKAAPDNISDCSNYITTHVDKVTGNKSLTAKEVLIVSQDGGKNGFGIYALKGSSVALILNIVAVGGSGCIDDKAIMNILFRDGTRLQLTNDGKFNCDSEYTQYFGKPFGKLKELEMFRTKEIETMRIWTTKGAVEENFTSEQSQELINIIRCILTN